MPKPKKIRAVRGVIASNWSGRCDIWFVTPDPYPQKSRNYPCTLRRSALIITHDPDALIEQGARAIYEQENEMLIRPVPFEDLDEESQDAYRQNARAAYLSLGIIPKRRAKK